MFYKTRSLVLALALGLPVAAFAQDTTTTQAPAADTTTEAPAAGDLSMGQDAGGQSDLYVKNTYGDWTLRCLHAKDGSDPCELYQLLKDDKGTSVAEVTMVTLPEGQQAALGATVIVPLETLLTAALQMALDTAKPKVYPFTFCAQVGCFARVGFTADEFAAMKKGNKMVLSVVPVANPKQVVSVNISLKGFTDATDALKAEQATAKKP